MVLEQLVEVKSDVYFKLCELLAAKNTSGSDKYYGRGAK
jgi:hypothetical protein